MADVKANSQSNNRQKVGSGVRKGGDVNNQKTKPDSIIKKPKGLSEAVNNQNQNRNCVTKAWKKSDPNMQSNNSQPQTMKTGSLSAITTNNQENSRPGVPSSKGLKGSNPNEDKGINTMTNRPKKDPGGDYFDIV